MKYFYILIAILCYLFMLTFTLTYLPAKLNRYDRFPHRVFLNEPYKELTPKMWMSASFEYIFIDEVDGKMNYTFTKDDIKMIVEDSQDYVIFLNDTEIGRCNKTSTCIDYDPLDEYSIHDLLAYREPLEVVLPNHPKMFDDIRLDQFLFRQSFLYFLGLGFIYFGLMREVKVKAFLSKSAEYFEKIQWLKDIEHKKIQVLIVRYGSLSIGILIQGYLIYILLQIHFL